MTTPDSAPETLPGLAEGGTSVPSAECTRRIRECCTGDLHRVRRVGAGTRLGLTLGVGAVALAALVLLARTGGAEAAPAGAWLGALGWAAVVAGVLAGGLALPAGARLGRGWRVAVLVAVPSLFVAVLALTGVALPWSEFEHKGGAHAVSCGTFSLVFGALTTGAVLAIWRGTDPFSPRLSGALAGLAGGMMSGVALGIACPAHEAWHLVLSHGLAVVAFVAAGALAGRRVLAP